MAQEGELLDKEVSGITPEMARDLGLLEQDYARVESLAEDLAAQTALKSISAFGRDVIEMNPEATDQILARATSRDLDEVGDKLREVIHLARGTNLGVLGQNRSRLPVVGPLVDRVVLKFKSMAGNFDTAKVQIENLVEQVLQTQTGLEANNAVYAGLQETSMAQYQEYGVRQAAGQICLKRWLAEAAELRGKPDRTEMDVQMLADLEMRAASLDKRLGDLNDMRELARQSIYSYRMMLKNNQDLIEQFNTINDTVLPLWKQQFAQRLLLNQTRNAADLGHAITDMTQDIIRANSAQLETNAIAVAKGNQRAVLGTDVLKETNDRLVHTLEEVFRIQMEGSRARQQAINSDHQRRDALLKLVSQSQVAPTAPDRKPA